ncbi:hypothetical protein V5740_06385 [Croceibacterium sp. TMG7-5b_MA50]
MERDFTRSGDAAFGFGEEVALNLTALPKRDGKREAIDTTFRKE